MPWRHLGGEEVQLLLILDLGTRWGWVVSITQWLHFTPGERTPCTHWIGGWVGPRAGLDAGARRKILCPCWESNPDRPAHSQTLYCLSYCSSRLLAEHNIKTIHNPAKKNIYLLRPIKDKLGMKVASIYCIYLLNAVKFMWGRLAEPWRIDARSTWGMSVSSNQRNQRWRNNGLIQVTITNSTVPPY
jgi:hypothetical protein